MHKLLEVLGAGHTETRYVLARSYWTDETIEHE
jgi:hypothetical protein